MNNDHIDRAISLWNVREGGTTLDHPERRKQEVRVNYEMRVIIAYD